jgi:hypothetical protein
MVKLTKDDFPYLFNDVFKCRKETKVIPTISYIEELIKFGFKPKAVQFQTVSNPERLRFQKHMVMFDTEHSNTDLVLINSLDGTTPLIITCGVFLRESFMILGDPVSIQGNREEPIEKPFKKLNVSNANEVLDFLNNQKLSLPERLKLAKYAFELRWGNKPNQPKDKNILLKPVVKDDVDKKDALTCLSTVF